MNFSNKISGFAATLATLTVLCLSSCTKVNYDLGYDFIPEHQKMTISLDTLDGVETFLYQYDSVISQNTNYMFIGKESSTVYGTRTNGCILQYLPIAIPYEGGFGLNPIIDSMYLRLNISSYNGDTTQTQTFDVYGLNTDADLHYDSTYYVNTDPALYYNHANLLFKFTYKGKSNLRTRMIPTALGKEFMKSLVATDTSYYNSDTLFRKKFKGFYITPDASSPASATYEFSLENAYMQLWLRDHDSIDHAKIKDTLAAWFYFYDSSDYGNLSINLAKHDYTGSTLGTLKTQTNNFTDTVNIQPTVYVQGWGGVVTKLRFTDAMVKALNNLKKTVVNGQTTECSIMINQAKMYLEMANYDPNSMATVPYINAAPTRLGSYLTMRSSSTDGYTPSPIPDYLYDIEKSYQTSDKTYMLPYNGYLNRSNGYYELDITSYIQQIMKGELRKTIIVGPSAYDFFGYGQVALKGLTTKPAKISITYTLIKPIKK